MKIGFEHKKTRVCIEAWCVDSIKCQLDYWRFWSYNCDCFSEFYCSKYTRARSSQYESSERYEVNKYSPKQSNNSEETGNCAHKSNILPSNLSPGCISIISLSRFSLKLQWSLILHTLCSVILPHSSLIPDNWLDLEGFFLYSASETERTSLPIFLLSNWC